MLIVKKNEKTGITVRIVNPEAIPATEKRIKEMMIEAINKKYSEEQ